MSVYQTITLTLGLGFEVLDWLLELLDLTGVGLIVLLVLDVLRVLIFLSLQLVFEGFSFKALFKGWKQALLVIGSFVLEFIPLADLLPGWLVAVVSWTMFVPKSKEEVAEKVTGSSD